MTNRSASRYSGRRPVRAIALSGTVLAFASAALVSADEKAKPPVKPAAAEQPGPGSAVIDRNHRLAAGDLIAVTVDGHDEFSRIVRLFQDGTFEMPAPFGLVKASGLTTEELKAKLTRVLSEELRRPSVFVELREIYVRPKEAVPTLKVAVAGAVSHQGPLDLEADTRLRRALDLAGIQADGDLTKVKVVHADLTVEVVNLSSDALVTDAMNNRLVRDGDSISVPSRIPKKEMPDLVRIGGAVTNGGPYELVPTKLVTLQDLIVAAGKLTPLADYRHVELHRKGEADRKYDLEALETMGLKGKIELQAGDEVFVPAEKDRIFLVGSVPRPGAYAFKPGQRIASFLLSPENPDVAAALGSQADLQNVQVVRQGKETIKVDLKKVIQHLGQDPKKRPKDFDEKENVALQPGDTIVMLAKDQTPPKAGPLQILSQLSPLSYLFTAF